MIRQRQRIFRALCGEEAEGVSVHNNVDIKVLTEVLLEMNLKVLLPGEAYLDVPVDDAHISKVIRAGQPDQPMMDHEIIDSNGNVVKLPKGMTRKDLAIYVKKNLSRGNYKFRAYPENSVAVINPSNPGGAPILVMNEGNVAKVMTGEGSDMDAYDVVKNTAIPKAQAREQLAKKKAAVIEAYGAKAKIKVDTENKVEYEIDNGSDGKITVTFEVFRTEGGIEVRTNIGNAGHLDPREMHGPDDDDKRERAAQHKIFLRALQRTGVKEILITASSSHPEHIGKNLFDILQNTEVLERPEIDEEHDYAHSHTLPHTHKPPTSKVETKTETETPNLNLPPTQIHHFSSLLRKIPKVIRMGIFDD